MHRLFQGSIGHSPVIKNKLNPSGLLIFAGDLNADPGASGGPASFTPANEQGRILTNTYSRGGLHQLIFT